jgi:hypothetical protein
MTRLLTLQLPVEVIADLLDGLETTTEACVATREYLDTGLCCDDYAMLPFETPEEAEWHLQFCRAVHASILAQLERQGARDLVREAATRNSIQR